MKILKHGVQKTYLFVFIVRSSLSEDFFIHQITCVYVSFYEFNNREDVYFFTRFNKFNEVCVTTIH